MTPWRACKSESDLFNCHSSSPSPRLLPLLFLVPLLVSCLQVPARLASSSAADVTRIARPRWPTRQVRATSIPVNPCHAHRARCFASLSWLETDTTVYWTLPYVPLFPFRPSLPLPCQPLYLAFGYRTSLRGPVAGIHTHTYSLSLSLSHSERERVCVCVPATGPHSDVRLSLSLFLSRLFSLARSVLVTYIITLA